MRVPESALANCRWADCFPDLGAALRCNLHSTALPASVLAVTRLLTSLLGVYTSLRCQINIGDSSIVARDAQKSIDLMVAFALARF